MAGWSVTPPSPLKHMSVSEAQLLLGVSDWQVTAPFRKASMAMLPRSAGSSEERGGAREGLERLKGSSASRNNKSYSMMHSLVVVAVYHPTGFDKLPRVTRLTSQRGGYFFQAYSEREFRDESNGALS